MEIVEKRPARFLFCVGPVVRAWLLVRPSTPSFHLSSDYFLTTLRIHPGITHPIVCIFHDANVVIPSMIWVSICYVACVRVSALQPMIHFEIPL